MSEPTMSEPPTSAQLLHLASAADWAVAEQTGVYRAPSLRTEGFMHCCTEDQLPGVVERYYQDRDDLVLVRIDPARLDSELRWEAPAAPAGERHAQQRFPHLYGPLPLDAVVATERYRPTRAR